MKPRRVGAKRIAAELAALERYEQHPDRGARCVALGARIALNWIQGNPPTRDPMYPSRFLSLLLCALNTRGPKGPHPLRAEIARKPGPLAVVRKPRGKR